MEREREKERESERERERKRERDRERNGRGSLRMAPLHRVSFFAQCTTDDLEGPRLLSLHHWVRGFKGPAPTRTWTKELSVTNAPPFVI